MRRLIECLLLAGLLGTPPQGSVFAAVRQNPGVVVRVSEADGPVEGALVRLGLVAALTDAGGEARLAVVAGNHELAVERLGFARLTQRVRIVRDTVIDVVLMREALEEESIVVVSTRGDRRIEDEPVRVEVLVREEIEEKMLMTPGSIAMLLNETTGLRVQETSPSLGGATIRVQGLRGRYTQLLADGLPLYGGQAGALGLLQIPPMDLRQVEVIKGAASALYGATALGGVVNLISRRPDGAREVLLNRTTRDGTDAVVWLAADPREDGWSWTLLGGAHAQNRTDVDEDAWADIPRHRRVSIRPRLYRDSGRGHSAMVTAGFMGEEREGGGVTPTGDAWPQDLGTRRADAGAVVRLLLGSVLLDARASAARTAHDHRFGDGRERDTHTTAYAEASLRGQRGAHVWAIGAAIQRDGFDSEDVPGFDYKHRVPSLFVHDEIGIAPWAALSLSARIDAHSAYGTIVSPRASALLRPGNVWTMRISAGSGYFAPTPFTEETEEVGLANVLPIAGLREERARSASADVGAKLGNVEINGTVFHSVVEHALAVRPSTTAIVRAELINLGGPTRTRGTELLLRYRFDRLGLTASHTFVHATEPAPAGGRRTVPRTPRHSAGLVAMYEVEGAGRVGLEVYYTGRQSLDDNPFRATSPAYGIVGMLLEKRFGPVRAFLNLENLTNVRMTRWHPVVLPLRGEYGRRTTDSWAPLEGRIFNGGVRLVL